MMLGVEVVKDRWEGSGLGVLVGWEGEEVRMEGRVGFDLHLATLVLS